MIKIKQDRKGGNMNYVVLMGRLTKDPEVKYTDTGKVVCIFSMAVDRPFSGQNGKREADFFNCQLWGKMGENLGNTVRKGQRVLVDGRVQIRPYQTKDGAKKQATEIVCNRFEYVERKDGNQQAAHGGFDDLGQVFDENIPF